MNSNISSMFGSHVDKTAKRTAIAILDACRTTRTEAGEVLMSCLERHSQKMEDETRDLTREVAEAAASRNGSVESHGHVDSARVVESNLKSTKLL